MPKSEIRAMYPPEPYLENRQQVLVNAISQQPFGTLITTGPSGILISHIPFVPIVGDDGIVNLLGHISRTNPQWHRTDTSIAGVATFVLDNAYISPNWYPSKARTNKMVPTWNYMAVEARGQVEFPDDPNGLLTILSLLTDRHEAERVNPWKVSDTPADFLNSLMQRIIGVRLTIERLHGIWKLDQRKTSEDRKGAIANLSQDARTQPLAAAMHSANQA